MQPTLVTIGVYGFTEERFFQSLLDAQVDTFVDLRRRRGVRGSQYVFANSVHLQRHLHVRGMKYVHFVSLAPSNETRRLQDQEDRAAKIAKRARLVLGEAFIQAYTNECLASFDCAAFVQQLGGDAHVIALFCVEGEPDACHRSLVARKLAQTLDLNVMHLRP